MLTKTLCRLAHQNFGRQFRSMSAVAELYNSEILSSYHEPQQKQRYYGIIESQGHMGQTKKGVEAGPAYLSRSSSFKGLMEEAETHNNWNISYHRINDIYGESPHRSNDKVDGIFNGLQLDDFNHKIYKSNVMSQGLSDLTINLLGDHSCAIGTLTSNKPDDIVVWIDAHPDINTHETSPTGNCHGMPVAIASGLAQPKTLFKWIPQYMSLNNIIYIGIRDIDPGEKHIIQEYGIKVIQVDPFLGHLDELANLLTGKNVHISFDVDSISPEYFPCTGTPVPNGLKPNDVTKIISTINQHSTIKKIDITEFNPYISSKYSLIDSCIDIIVNNVLRPVMIN